MVDTKAPVPAAAPMPVFPVACAVLGLMAFTQLLVAGMALATRFEQSQLVRVVEKEVLTPVIVRVPAPAAVAAIPVAAAPATVSRPPTRPPALTPTPIAMPKIAEPRAEQLVHEARVARVAGDMSRAIVKLEEALAQAPGDPSVEFELGLVHEQMGVFDTASAHYQKVLDMGITGAGMLYEQAAAKLRDGFEQPADMLGKLSFGRIRIFKDPNYEGGQRVILTIPVQKGPTETIDVADLAVSVIFFNRTAKGEIVQLEDKSWVSERWITLPFDWAGGEECLRMTYIIPAQDNQTEHLFGGRTYYGQVVSLLYKDEVLDVQAWPRDLAARIPTAPAAGPGGSLLPEIQDQLPPDAIPDAGLLPALPSN